MCARSLENVLPTFFFRAIDFHLDTMMVPVAFGEYDRGNSIECCGDNVVKFVRPVVLRGQLVNMVLVVFEESPDC